MAKTREDPDVVSLERQSHLDYAFQRLTLKERMHLLIAYDPQLIQMIKDHTPPPKKRYHAPA